MVESRAGWVGRSLVQSNSLSSCLKRPRRHCHQNTSEVMWPRGCGAGDVARDPQCRHSLLLLARSTLPPGPHRDAPTTLAHPVPRPPPPETPQPPWPTLSPGHPPRRRPNHPGPPWPPANPPRRCPNHTSSPCPPANPPRRCPNHPSSPCHQAQISLVAKPDRSFTEPRALLLHSAETAAPRASSHLIQGREEGATCRSKGGGCDV